MLKYIIAALLSLELVLFSSAFFAPAQATETDPSFYIWDYAAVGQSQVVCKQVVMKAENRPLASGVDQQPVSVQSHPVDSQFCAHLTKPAA